MYGTQNLTAAIVLIIETRNELRKILTDGKVKLMEALGLLDNLQALAVVYANREQIRNEFKDLSAEEVRQIEMHLKNRFPSQGDPKSLASASIQFLATLEEII